MKKTSVIIPAHNESEFIEKTINSVKLTGMVDEIIVVDDGSDDSTYDIAKKNGAIVIRNDKKRGKGNALMKGLQECSGDVIVFLDADVGGSAVEISKIIIPVKMDICDVAIARFGRAKKKGGFGLVKLISRYGAFLLCGRYIESILSGQRAFKAEVLKNISIGNGYGAEVGMTIDIVRKGYTLLEWDVNMMHRETGRDLKGFIHRGKQMCHILQVLFLKALERRKNESERIMKRYD
ncbi:MAG: glycosyltransferase family 2 protein [Clostridiaceae bacterium]|nr:glycosyltransferase family 2 protein [Clostridiaceae bacterium]